MAVPAHISAVLHAAAPFGAAWLVARRNLYRRIAEPLSLHHRRRLAPWFDQRLLARVEIARVPFISNPLPLRAARRLPGGMLDLSTVRGMAFIDTIVLADANLHPSDDVGSLLFHELVHVVQYQLLGPRGFARAYLSGWLASGRSYLDNPLEAIAFDLQARFDAGRHSFAVEESVQIHLAAMSY